MWEQSVAILNPVEALRRNNRMNIIKRILRREIKAEAEREKMMGAPGIETGLIFERATAEKSCEDENTVYVTIPDGLRLIFRNGRYAGWYVCGEQEASDA